MENKTKSIEYGKDTAMWLIQRTPDWKEMKNFRLEQEVNYYLKYYPFWINFGIAKKAALDEIKRIRKHID